MILVDLGYPRGKFPSIAADTLGWIVPLQDEADGELKLLQLDEEGERRVPDVTLPAGGGNAFPVVWVDPATWHTWIAWRHEQIGGIVLNVTTSDQKFLGWVFGNSPIAIGDGVVWYQGDAGYGLRFRFMTSLEDEHPSFVSGRPTGLAGVNAQGVPLLVDDVRLTVPGMVNPQRAGRCVVGENADAGPDRNIARLDDGREAVLWPAWTSRVPQIATDGRGFAVVTSGAPGARMVILTDPPDFRPVQAGPDPDPDPQPDPDPPDPLEPENPMPQTFTLDQIDALLLDDVPEDLFLGALVRFRNEVCLPRDRMSAATTDEGQPANVSDIVTGGALLFFARGFNKGRNRARLRGVDQAGAAELGLRQAAADYRRAVGLPDPQ